MSSKRPMPRLFVVRHGIYFYYNKVSILIEKPPRRNRMVAERVSNGRGPSMQHTDVDRHCMHSF